MLPLEKFWEEYGLSPRVRGNRGRGRRRPRREGSIPACAGEPSSPFLRISCRGVYPRVCGGTYTEGGKVIYAWGLSPRVRGNRRQRRVGKGQGGSIPACAGEPCCSTMVSRSNRVYPRVWRGNRAMVFALAPIGGSIPACAGEPVMISSSLYTFAVYPRVCGGTETTTPAEEQGLGLSPRVRGNPLERKLNG